MPDGTLSFGGDGGPARGAASGERPLEKAAAEAAAQTASDDISNGPRTPTRRGATPTRRGTTPASEASEMNLPLPASTPLLDEPLSRPVELLMKVLTFVATAAPDTSKAELAPGRVLSARLLLSLYAVDAFSWGTGQIFKYEVVSLVKEKQWCYLVASIILTAAETCIEFVASYVTPYLYERMQGSSYVSPRQLVHFALRVYFASNLLALCVYPCFGLAIHWLGFDSTAVIVLFGVVRSGQYAFGNQLGDAAVEMAKPHWMTTFDGSRLVLPGCCRPLLTRRSTEDHLACYITLIKFILMFLMGGLYVVVREKVVLRWGMASALLIWNAFAPFVLLKNFGQLAQALPERVSEREDTGDGEAKAEPGVRRLTLLRFQEVSFLIFVVVMRGVPPQSAEALMNVIMLELASGVQLGMVVVGGLGILVAVLLKIHWRPDAPLEDRTSLTAAAAESEEDGTSQNGSFVRQWLRPAFTVTVLIALGAVCTTFLGRNGIYVAIIVWLPTGPVLKLWDTSLDSFLFRYEPAVVTDLAYWQNVLAVLIQLPLLAVNWISLESADCTQSDGAELRAASLLLFIASGVLFLLCMYFACVDPSLHASRSLKGAVEGQVRSGLRQ